jgi:hypothetical protein
LKEITATPLLSAIPELDKTAPFGFVTVNVTSLPGAGDDPACTLAVIWTSWLRV